MIFDKVIAILDRFIKKPCKHHWRPALGMNKPVRYCDLCDLHEPITEAEFYAQFGKMPHRWASGPMGEK